MVDSRHPSHTMLRQPESRSPKEVRDSDHACLMVVSSGHDDFARFEIWNRQDSSAAFNAQVQLGDFATKEIGLFCLCWKQGLRSSLNGIYD
jgi:hypothetical protein